MNDWEEWLEQFWDILKSLNSFKGRVRASTSWIMIVCSIIFFVIFNTMNYIFMRSSEGISVFFIGVAYIPMFYLLFATYVTMYVQRLHDLGFSGFWWFLTMPLGAVLASKVVYPLLAQLCVYLDICRHLSEDYIVPITIILWLTIYCIPGKDEPNKYGAERK